MSNRQDCKVFIGGLSWETSDQKLRGYFENYGAVQEAFVSYDRNTGRPRGFGFVVFESADVADKVVACKHTIDRREVEAKKAVPKEDTNNLRQHQGSQNNKTKKIFVGGLPPTVDEKVLRQYFEQFGGLEDAVVMYDHENKRPRGFGFVTFVSEDSVEKVFNAGPMQSIHEKQIEIKPAVPRDQMPPVRRHFTYPPGKAYPPRAPYGAFPPHAAAAPPPYRHFPTGPHPQGPPMHPPQHMVPGAGPPDVPLQQHPQHPQHSHTPRTSAAPTSTSFSSVPAYHHHQQPNGLPSGGMPGTGHSQQQGMPGMPKPYGMPGAEAAAYSGMGAPASMPFPHHPVGPLNYLDVNGLSQQLATLGKISQQHQQHQQHQQQGGGGGGGPVNATVKAYTGLPAGLQFDFSQSRAMDTSSYTQHPEPSTINSGSLTSGDPEVQAYDVNPPRPSNLSSTAGITVSTTTGIAVSAPFSSFSEPAFSAAPAPGWTA